MKMNKPLENMLLQTPAIINALLIARDNKRGLSR